MAGSPGARGAHDQPGRGLVAAAHQHRAVGRVGAQRLLHLDGEQVAVHHRGRLAVGLRQRGDAELHREPAGLPHAPLDLFRALPQVHVARVQLGPGVQDGDDRLALMLGRGHPVLPHPRPVAERPQAHRAEPARAAQRFRCLARHRFSSPRDRPQSARISAIWARTSSGYAVTGRAHVRPAQPELGEGLLDHAHVVGRGVGGAQFLEGPAGLPRLHGAGHVPAAQRRPAWTAPAPGPRSPARR